MADVEHYLGKPNVSERVLLEKTLKSLDEEELASARLHAKGKMSEEVWDILWKGWQDQRKAIESTLQAIDETCEAHIASLDDALSLIAKLDATGQRQLLQHMVERVVINPEGRVLRIELRTPFSYLRSLARSHDECPSIPTRDVRNGSKKTDNANCSILISFGVPNETQDEPKLSSFAGQPVDSLLQFLESIKYPQRAGLERLLTAI